MTPAEFKAWFEGFVEGIEGVPTLKQWERVKERAASITQTLTPYPVYVERYWPTWPHARYYEPRPYYPYFQNLMQAQQGMQQSNLQNQCSANVQPQAVANNLRDYYSQGLSQLQSQSLAADARAAAKRDGFDPDRCTVNDADEMIKAMRELGRKERSEIN